MELMSMESILNLIDFKLLALIVISARWGKRYLLKCCPKVLMSYKVLVLSTLVSLVYYYIGNDAGFLTKDSFIDLLITYFTATSFYELIFNPIEKLLKKKFSGVKNSGEDE